MEKTTLEFSELHFEPHPLGEGVRAHTQFENGYAISVIAGKMAMSSPPDCHSLNQEDYDSFECAIFDSENEFVTPQFFPYTNRDVKGHCSKEEVAELMNTLHTYEEK